MISGWQRKEVARAKATSGDTLTAVPQEQRSELSSFLTVILPVLTALGSTLAINALFSLSGDARLAPVVGIALGVGCIAWLLVTRAAVAVLEVTIAHSALGVVMLHSHCMYRLYSCGLRQVIRRQIPLLF